MSKAKKTPIRAALKDQSSLRSGVADGLGAVKKSDRSFFDAVVRADFADSVDIDAGLRAGREQKKRWDYLLGHAPSQLLVAVEPHSAKQDEIAVVIGKRASAREQLKAHLKDGSHVSRWLWVASGKVHFADTEKARRRLDQNGIMFVGTKVMARHLPAGGAGHPQGAPTRRSVRG